MSLLKFLFSFSFYSWPTWHLESTCIGRKSPPFKKNVKGESSFRKISWNLFTNFNSRVGVCLTQWKVACQAPWMSRWHRLTFCSVGKGLGSSSSALVKFTLTISDLLSFLVFCCCLKAPGPTSPRQPAEAWCWVWPRHGKLKQIQFQL